MVWWFVIREVKKMLKKLLTLSFISGYRTKLIGGGMILSGLGTLLTHLAKAIGGEPIDGAVLQTAGASIVMGYGVIKAAIHK